MWNTLLGPLQRNGVEGIVDACNDVFSDSTEGFPIDSGFCCTANSCLRSGRTFFFFFKC